MKVNRPILFGFAAALFISLLTPPSHAVITPIIKPGDDGWAYLDNGNTPAATWKNIVFTPTAPWVTNAIEDFGYPKNDTDPVHTLKTEILFGGNASAKAISYYFRKTFTIADTDAVKQLIIGLRRDDGAIVYINGEVVRDSVWDNMPLGTITSSTLALSAVGGTNETRYWEKVIANDKPSAPAQRLLVNGTNVIAVEVHQNVGSSSDIHFGLSLNASDQEVCFGEARPGIAGRFSNALYVVSLTEKNYIRYFAGEDELQYNITYGKVNSGLSWPADVLTRTETFITAAQLPSRNLLIDGNTNFVLTSEPIDCRNFKNISAKVKVRGYNSGNWETADFVKGSILTSVDGKTFTTTIPWFELRGQIGGSVEQRTTIVTTTATNRWLVPTATFDPSTLTSGTPNWTHVTPTGWTAVNTPPAGATGDQVWSASSGGLGYDDNPATDYSPFINAAAKAAIRAKLFNIRRTNYIRYPFTVTTPAQYTKWYLKMRYDDGYVAFVNGVKVAEKLASAAPYDKDDFASAGRTDTTCIVPEEVDITGTIPVLANGSNNVLCILSLNETVGSSDLMAQPELIAAKIIAAPPGNGLNSVNSPDAGPYPDPLPAALSTASLIPNGIASMKIKLEGAIENGRIVNGDSDETIFIDDLETFGEALFPDSFDTYAIAQIPNAALRGMKQDGDGDGIQNLVEYACVSPMGTPNQSVTPAAGPMSALPVVTLDSQGRMVMKFRKINYSPDTINPFSDEVYSISADGFIQVDDINYLPQLSYNLGNPADPLSDYDNEGVIWLDNTQSSYLSEVLPRIDNDDGTETVTVRTRDPVVGAESRAYMRLKIILDRPSYIQEENATCPF